MAELEESYKREGSPSSLFGGRVGPQDRGWERFSNRIPDNRTGQPTEGPTSMPKDRNAVKVILSAKKRPKRPRKRKKVCFFSRSPTWLKRRFIFLKKAFELIYRVKRRPSAGKIFTDFFSQLTCLNSSSFMRRLTPTEV